MDLNELKQRLNVVEEGIISVNKTIQTERTRYEIDLMNLNYGVLIYNEK